MHVTELRQLECKFNLFSLNYCYISGINSNVLQAEICSQSFMVWLTDRHNRHSPGLGDHSTCPGWPRMCCRQFRRTGAGTVDRHDMQSFHWVCCNHSLLTGNQGEYTGHHARSTMNKSFSVCLLRPSISISKDINLQTCAVSFNTRVLILCMTPLGKCDNFPRY